MSTMFAGSLKNLKIEGINIELTLAMLTFIPQDIHYSVDRMGANGTAPAFLSKSRSVNALPFW